jgi:hypothetical protein
MKTPLVVLSVMFGALLLGIGGYRAYRAIVWDIDCGGRLEWAGHPSQCRYG